MRHRKGMKLYMHAYYLIKQARAYGLGESLEGEGSPAILEATMSSS